MRKKIVYKERGSEPVAQTSESAQQASNNPAAQDPVSADAAPVAAANPSNANEKYVAQLLREKTALEVAIDKL